MTNTTPQGVTLREAQNASADELFDDQFHKVRAYCSREEYRSIYRFITNRISEIIAGEHPPAPEQASGELVASADCPLCGKDTPHGHGTEDIAEWLRIQARRFVGANADDLIRINTSEVHLIDSLRRQIQELEHRVESLTPETSYENYGKSDAELKALFATTKEEATHNGIEFLMHGKNMAFKIGVQSFTLAYEPDEPEEFEFMKSMLLHALSTFTPDVKTAVDRFIGWKLPYDFYPDCYIEFDRAKANAMGSWPIGTNLFTVDQAKAMFEYALSASPAAPEAAKPEQQAQAGCDYCNNPMFAGFKCDNCGRKTEQQAQAGEPMHDSAVPVWKYHELERKNTALHFAIAKKDAALEACVGALKTCQIVQGVTGWEYIYDIQKVEDSIAQANEVLK